MKGKLLLALAFVVLGALGVAVAVGARGGTNRASATLRVIERATSDTLTDSGKKGDSVGDVLTFANTIVDGRGRRTVGSDNGFCLRTALGKAWECNWTTFLPGGQITVEGPFNDAGDSKLAITGGPGSYANARRWMLLHARNAQDTENDFTFHES